LRTVALALAVSTTACSFIASNGPSSYNPPGTRAPSCSTSVAAPFADSIFAFVNAIPTVAAAAIAWDDPRWTYDDGAPGGAQVGAWIGTPFAAIMTLWILSARRGFLDARHCEAAHERAAQSMDPHGDACRAVFQALADVRLAYADPLPSWCSVRDAEAAFLLADAPALAGGRTTLAVTDQLAGRSVLLWLAGESVTAVAIERPRLPASWRTILGEPDARLDDGTWFYGPRGLALTLEGDAVTRVLVFAPTTVESYQAHYASVP